MKALNYGVAFLFGLAFGGCLHLWLLHSAVQTRLQQQHIDSYPWGFKPPGEQLSFLLIPYWIACICLFAVVVMLYLPASLLALRRGLRLWRWYTAAYLPFVAVVLGTGCASGVNLWIAETEYREAVTEGGWFALSTVTVALPAMRDFTLVYCGVLAALLALASIGYLLLHRRRVLLPA